MEEKMQRVQRIFDQSSKMVEKMVDALDHPVDEKIRKLLAALITFGVRTTASCEGHMDQGHPYPWIHVVPEDAIVLSALLARQNRPTREDGAPNNNRWTIVPEGNWLSLEPRDLSRPLAELQHDAEKFAARLREIAARR